ncbi:MAG: YfgM family protein [Candidatus Binataceae bacterium]
MATTTRHRPKIRRKDLKQPDEFMTVAYSVEEFVEHHLRKAIAGLVTILIVAAAIFAIYQHQLSVKHEAAEQFYEGFSALNSKDYKGAEQKFDALIADHPSSEAAHLARFYRALAFLGNGDLAQARDGLEDYTQGAVVESMHELALMDLGVVYEQMGEYAKAVDAYRRAADLNGPESANAHLAVARTLQLRGKRDAAVAAYQDFLKANPYSAQRDTVVQALANLGVSAPASPNVSMPPAP